METSGEPMSSPRLIEAGTITVIDLVDWSLLFVDSLLVAQGHASQIDDILRASKREPLTRTWIGRCGSSIEAMVKEQGRVPASMTLSEAWSLIVQNRRKFTASENLIGGRWVGGQNAQARRPLTKAAVTTAPQPEASRQPTPSPKSPRGKNQTS